MTTAPEIGHAEHLTTAETAKLVRKALVKAFPSYTFRVRSDVYAGGSSIRVSWYDGPPEPVVESVVKCYAGGRFDGMIDMAYNVQHWLEPDGTAYLADSPGTQGSRGIDPEYIGDPQSPNARLVYFGADYVFADRHLTPEAEALIKRKTAETRPWYADADEYERGRLEHEVGRRWLFPPTEYVFAVERMAERGVYVTEAEGLTSKTAAENKARELQKARNPRGFRYVRAHRKAGK